MLPLLAPVLDVQLPDAAFYLWAGVRSKGGGPADEVAWARGLLAQYNVNVLPGSLLARSVQGPDPSCPSVNPGAGRVRMALVAPLDECLEAAQRIVAYSENPA